MDAAIAKHPTVEVHVMSLLPAHLTVAIVDYVSVESASVKWVIQGRAAKSPFHPRVARIIAQGTETADWENAFAILIGRVTLAKDT